MRYGTMGSPPGGTADSGVSVGTATIGLTSGNTAAVPSLGRIANHPDLAISDSGGIVDASGLARLDQLPGNDILVFVPDGNGNYVILFDPTTGSGGQPQFFAGTPREPDPATPSLSAAQLQAAVTQAIADLAAAGNSVD